MRWRGLRSGIRKRADALLVVAIRPGDVVFAVDPAVAAVDAVDLIETALPRLLEQMDAQRTSKQRSLRLERQPGEDGREE